MFSLEPPSVFDGFGPWTPAPWLALCAREAAVPDDLRHARKLLRGEVPRAPGVYGMVNARGELIYVGQSKSLRDRLLSYFAKSAPGKSRKIVEQASRLVWEAAPGELAAQLRELELIRRWRPRFNVRGQPNRLRSAYLVLGPGPAPRIQLSAIPAGGDVLVFGPVRASRAQREAARVLNDCFQLCTCGPRKPVHFADQGELFEGGRAARCLRRDLGKCLGPCAAACSSSQYGQQVRAARRFLQGLDLGVMKRLKEAMSAASTARRYEEAATLRDLWETLDALHVHLRRVRAAQRHFHFVYPTGPEDRRLWYLVRAGQVAAVVREPCDAATAAECLAVVERVFPPGEPRCGAAAVEDLEMVLLVTGWFQSHAEEMQCTISIDEARSRSRLPRRRS